MNPNKNEVRTKHVKQLTSAIKLLKFGSSMSNIFCFHKDSIFVCRGNEMAKKKLTPKYAPFLQAINNSTTDYCPFVRSDSAKSILSLCIQIVHF